MISEALIKKWKEEVMDKCKEVDPGDELHWESLATGWALAKGVSIDESCMFGMDYLAFSDYDVGGKIEVVS